MISNTIGFSSSILSSTTKGSHNGGAGGALSALFPSQPATAHTEDHDLSLGGTAPRLEVRESDGKGYGLFAVDHVPAFTRILSDDALLSLAEGEDLPQLWEKYLSLPSELKHTFHKLSAPSDHLQKEAGLVAKLVQRGYREDEAAEMARASSRFQANAFKTGGGSRWLYALFPMVARINHSCTPNAHSHYRANSGAQVVYALRDIQPGEEIEIAYFDLTMPVHERRRRATSWDFQCQCPACCDELGEDYGRRLAVVHQSVSSNDTARPSDRIARLRKAIDQAISEIHPWLAVALPGLYQNLATAVVQTQGPERQAQAALKGMHRWESRLTGADSPQSAAASRLAHTLDSKSSK